MRSMEKKEPARLLALSDGLFATVLTLLVLDLRLPEALASQGASVRIFLQWLGPHMFSYLLTFFVAGVYWVAHHRDFDHITGYDRGLLGYNLLFLLFIGLLPFSTALISLAGFRDPTYAFYWAVYCANIILAGATLTLVWLYASSHGQVGPRTTAAQSRHIIWRQVSTPAVFLLSAVVQLLIPRPAIGPELLFIIPLVQWGVDRAYARAEPDAQAAHHGKWDVLWRVGTTVLWVALILLAAWMSTM